MRVFGGIMLAVGILVAGLSGLCSLGVLFSPGGDEFGGSGMWPIVLVFGGIPFAAGAASALIGWRAIRRARAERKPDLDKINDVFE